MANHMQRSNQESGAAAQALVVDDLQPCMIQASADGTWHVTTQLGAVKQDALGLVGIGSRIALDRDAIGVYIPTSPAPFSTTPLVLEGHPLLWAVSRASSETIRALISAAIEIMRAGPNPPRTSSH